MKFADGRAEKITPLRPDFISHITALSVSLRVVTIGRDLPTE
jgi:hypothetical protein